jgi:hypothetical protein
MNLNPAWERSNAFFLALCFDLSGLRRPMDRAAADEGGYINTQDSNPVLKVTGKIDTVGGLFLRLPFSTNTNQNHLISGRQEHPTAKQLQSGASVTVTYREDSGQNVAIRVETNS